MLHLNAPFFPLKCSVSPKKSLRGLDNAHYTNGFFKINFKVQVQVQVLQRASVASNNDDVYQFINTAKKKKPAVLGFW